MVEVYDPVVGEHESGAVSKCVAEYASVTELLVDFVYNIHVAPEWG